MPHFQIKHRYTDTVLFEGAFDTMLLCVGAAVRARAYLADADLAGANLARAYLAGADLARANLAGAYLARANLAGAYLAGANLAGANLARANLAGADLAGADLAGADLAGGCVAGGAPARRARRSDGYEFLLWPTDKGWRIGAGCRWFTPDKAWRHWEATRAGTELGDETFDILTMFELHMERAK